MSDLSEVMAAKWQDPEYRMKVKLAQDKAWNRRMKRRLEELAKGAEK